MLGGAAAVAVRGRGGRHPAAQPDSFPGRRLLVSVETAESRDHRGAGELRASLGPRVGNDPRRRGSDKTMSGQRLVFEKQQQ